MSAIGTDPSLATTENEKLREELERESTRNNKLKKALQKVREDMNNALKELPRMNLLERQIERALNSLRKEKANLEETLIKILHSFDELVPQTDR